MKLQQKIAINNMRLEGYSSASIAAKLGLPAGTVRSYIHRNAKSPEAKLCKQCGKAITDIPKGREKKFCSDSCRLLWWNSHQETVNRKAYYSLKCNYCGKEFESFGNRNRKYCCRTCYLASRHAG